MKERKYVIKITNDNSYIKQIYRNQIGFFFIKTQKIERAKTWSYGKNCQKTIDNLTNKPDPTKDLKKYQLELVEITDNQILRKIKLKKINILRKEKYNYWGKSH